jgi:hypothetical protein
MSEATAGTTATASAKQNTGISPLRRQKRRLWSMTFCSGGEWENDNRKYEKQWQ